MIDVSNSWSAVSSQPEAFSEARVCFFRSSEIVNRPLAWVSSVEMSFACASMPALTLAGFSSPKVRSPPPPESL
jgi:hypothetical protein